jgi:hypothetical protein
MRQCVYCFCLGLKEMDERKNKIYRDLPPSIRDLNILAVSARPMGDSAKKISSVNRSTCVLLLRVMPLIN